MLDPSSKPPRPRCVQLSSHFQLPETKYSDCRCDKFIILSQNLHFPLNSESSYCAMLYRFSHSNICTVLSIAQKMLQYCPKNSTYHLTSWIHSVVAIFRVIGARLFARNLNSICLSSSSHIRCEVNDFFHTIVFRKKLYSCILSRVYYICTKRLKMTGNEKNEPQVRTVRNEAVLIRSESRIQMKTRVCVSKEPVKTDWHLFIALGGALKYRESKDLKQ